MTHQYGYVYEIVTRDLERVIYIGSTTNLYCRTAAHKSATNNCSNRQYKSSLYNFMRNNGGFGNHNIRVAWEGVCFNKRDLCVREQAHIDSNRDIMLFNKISAVQDIERARTLNRERSLARYYARHVEINKHMTCYCGSVHTYNGRHMHRKTQKHRTYEPFAIESLFDGWV